NAFKSRTCTVFGDPANHLQTVFSLVSFWSSEGNECQCHRRAEGKGAADDNEKHDTYKSTIDAPLGFFAASDWSTNNSCNHLVPCHLALLKLSDIRPKFLGVFSRLGREATIRFSAIFLMFVTVLTSSRGAFGRPFRASAYNC